jgi:hypothetical protein
MAVSSSCGGIGGCQHLLCTLSNLLQEYSIVAALIDQDLKGLNLDLIKEMFSEDEAKVISNIPLSHLLPHDRMIWRGITNGVFTLHNAYLLGKEL